MSHIFHELGDRAGEARSAHQIGIAHQLKGELDKALEWYEKSMDIKKEVDDRAGEASNAHQIGMTYLLKGDLNKALEWCEKSMGMYREVDDRAGEALSLRQRGRLYLAQDRPERAVEEFVAAYRLFCEVRAPQRIMALQDLVEVLGEWAGEGGDDALEQLRDWLEVLLKELQVAMEDGEDPRFVEPALVAAGEGLERYRGLVGDGWEDAPKLFHDMAALIERLVRGADVPLE